MLTTGHAGTLGAGSDINPGGEPAFATEALRLARLLDRLMPAQPEVRALLALILFRHSRRDARCDADGNLLSLARQDRTRWDRAAIADGLAALAGTGGDGPYAVQARIAACHATANPVEATDWPAIARGTTGRYGCSARRWWR